MTNYDYSMLPNYSATRSEFERDAPVWWKHLNLQADIVELELKERAIIQAGRELNRAIKTENDADKKRTLEFKKKHRTVELAQCRASIAAYKLRYQQGIDAGLGVLK